jgi:hypothetical protein
MIYTKLWLDDLVKAKAALAQTQVEAGPTGEPATYAPYLEYGTSKMAARPFLRPAVEMVKPILARLAHGAVSLSMRSGGGQPQTQHIQAALVQAIQDQIRAQGLIKTGALLASIRAERTK